MRMPTLFFTFALPGLLFAQCPPSGSRVVEAVDDSHSIRMEQRIKWEPAAMQLAACAGPGSKLEVYQVTDNTANDAPVLSLGVPVQSSHTLAGARKYIVDLNQYRAETRNTIETAFAKDAPGETDLFGAIARAAHDGPPGLLALFTDGYHSAYDPNLERVAIQEKDIPALVRKVADRHHLTGQSLTQTKVYMILPGGAHQIGPNNRETLEIFYRALFQSLGATLARFDDHL